MLTTSESLNQLSRAPPPAGYLRSHLVLGHTFFPQNPLPGRCVIMEIYSLALHLAIYQSACHILLHTPSQPLIHQPNHPFSHISSQTANIIHNQVGYGPCIMCAKTGINLWQDRNKQDKVVVVEAFRSANPIPTVGQQHIS